MNRRAFFGRVVGGIAAGAAVRSWPYRVFSFPTQPIAITAARIHEALEMPIALRGPNRSFAMGCCDGAELGSYGVTYWRKASTYGELESALKDGYQLPERWSYDPAKRLLVTDSKYRAPISIADIDRQQFRTLLEGKWKT